jgi:hypothetical protein
MQVSSFLLLTLFYSSHLTMLFAILALLAAQALAAPSNGPIHIPLVRHDRTLVKRAAYQQK